MMAVLAVVMTLLLVVGVHELGHALLALWFGVGVTKISIGFGRPLLQWQDKCGVAWVWALWPLGGYVRLLNTRTEPVPLKRWPQCFDKQSPMVRIGILIAGVAANLICAWVALLMVLNLGILQRPAAIAKVLPNSVAAKSGLQNGDIIVAFNQASVHSWQDFARELILAMRLPKASMQVLRSNGQKAVYSVPLTEWKLQSKKLSLLRSLGLQPDNKAIKQLQRADSFGQSLLQSTILMGQLGKFYLVLLGRTLSGTIPFSALLGPLGAINVSIASFNQGGSAFLLFIAHFSIAVAVLNALPIPGLDGASILYVLIEKIRGRPVSIALEILLFRLAVIVFSVLLVHLLMNDLGRIES